jgi:hypothetical protein
LTSAQRDLASWIAREIVGDPDRFMTAAQVLGPNLNPLFWLALAWTVWQLQSSDRETVAKWVPSLLSTAPINTSSFLDYILNGCQWPIDRAIALLLFDWLTEPRWSVTPWSNIELRGDAHWFEQTWPTLFAPNLEDCATTLLPMVYRHLETAFLMLAAAGKASSTFDPMSYGRSAIEPHQQDALSQDGITVLIDVCRDSLVFLLERDPIVGGGYLRSMEQSRAPLVRRIAVHGWSERSDVTDDARLDWLLSRGLVWDFPAKHEVFRLIRESLPGASLASKQRLLGEVLRGQPPSPDSSATQDPSLGAYSLFNYLVWLTDADPMFQEATAALAEIRGEWPDFGAREHPDMDHWTSGGFVGPNWPMKPEELLARDPGDVLPELLAYKDRPSNFFEPGWNDVCGLVTEAVHRDSAWGFRVASALGELDEWESELWSATIQGWSMGSLNAAEWVGVIAVLLDHRSPVAIRNTAAQLLEKGSRAPQGTLPIDVIPMASALAQRLWETPEEHVDRDSWGWLQTAINQWSGRVAEFWLYSIEQLWRADPEQWTGLDIDTGERLRLAITGTEDKNGFARSIFAGQLHFLAGADLDWSRKHVVPLFDWDRSSEEAEQTWDGYLTWARWTQPLLPALMPLYLQAIVRLPQDETHRRDRLFEHLAGIALFGSVERFGPNGWLDRAIASADSKDRVHFAQHVGRGLKDAPPEFAHNAFEKWIERYWKRRLDSVPIPLEPGEGLEMSDWVLYAGDRFEMTVKLFARSPIASSQSHRRFFRDLEQSNLPSQFPGATAVLVLSLIRSLTGPIHDAEQLERLVRLLAESLTDTANRSVLSDICGEAVRLRIPEADTWM